MDKSGSKSAPTVLSGPIGQSLNQSGDPVPVPLRTDGDVDGARVRLRLYKMKTSTGNDVTVGVPFDESTNKAPAEPRYQADCHTYAMKSFDKFGYWIHTGFYLVLNDPTLFKRVVDNEPPIKPGTDGILACPNDAGTKLPHNPISSDEHRFQCLGNTEVIDEVSISGDSDPKKIQVGDIMVFWRFAKQAESADWNLQAAHSIRMIKVTYNKKRCLDLENSFATDKNGFEPVHESRSLTTIQDALRSEGYRWLYKVGDPVGVYRPLYLSEPEDDSEN